MSEIDLDLQTVEEELETDEDGERDEDGDRDRDVVLGVLDGTTPDEEWVELVDAGNVLVLNVEGDVNELASGFAREITELDGDLMQFRGFLVVTPADTGIDADRVG
jgi:hypothetical protein